MENNLYVKLLFVGLTALGTASVNAQNQDNINSWYRGVDIRPLPPLDILHEHLPPVNIPVKQQTGNKPTAIKQRETGYFITNTDGNGNIMSQDSGANFMYSGSRGTMPDNSDMPVPFSSYDAASQYEYTDNFSAEKYKLTQEFNSANLILNGHKHNNTTNQDDIWIDEEYYPDNSVKKLSNMNYLDEDHSMYIFKNTEYNSSGGITVDSLMQEAPGNPNAHYYQVAHYDYDNAGRKSHVYAKIDVLETNGPYNYYTDDYYYFYDGEETTYYKDSLYIYVLNNDGTTGIIKEVHYYNYNSANQPTQRFEFYNSTSNLDTTSKIEYTYDGNGNLTQALTFSKSNGLWNNFAKTTYEYANNLLTQKTAYIWSNNVWELSTKETYHLNNQSLVDIYALYYGPFAYGSMSGIPAEGLLVEKINYLYSDFKNLEFKQDESYAITSDGTGGYSMVPGNKFTGHYYYTTYDDGTAVNSINKNNINAVIYPNPAESAFMISVPVEALKNDLSFAVCDMEGRLLKFDNIQQQNTLVNIPGIPAGIYILKISDKTNSKHYNQHIVIK